MEDASWQAKWCTMIPAGLRIRKYLPGLNLNFSVHGDASRIANFSIEVDK